jgi:hypothetical protein
MPKVNYDHLKQTASEAAKKSIEMAKGEDGGTCNLDAVFLEIPGVRKYDKVIETLRAGGINSYKKKWLGCTGLLMMPVGCGQANSRVRACDAIKEVFSKAGYSVMGYYMMD